MKHPWILSIIAACGGGSATAPAPGPAAGGVQSSVQPPADPALAYRLQYTNPGGMWMPEQMALPGHGENFRKMGAALDAKTLSDPLAGPLAAVVSLGGCTASFVSPQGLIVTNHHCVQDALQINSTESDNLVEKGFLAKTHADEKPASPAQRVFVAQAFTDVTAQMRDGLDKITDPVARKLESEARQKRLIAACERGRPELRCQVSGFFRGGKYKLIESLEIRDVRLVYAPARAVGNYGGEVDNWAWPRHTGDFSFYRAYVGKDGKPADYAADNVPFQPKHHLKVSSSGIGPGDFVMVAGYPATTSRTITALETRHAVEWFYPYWIAYAKERYALAERYNKAPGETGIKAGVLRQSIQNGLERQQGVLAGMTGSDALQRKDAIDAQIKAWAARPGNEVQRAAIEKLEQLIVDEHRTARADFDRARAFDASRLFGAALQIVRWAEERAKNDADRKPNYQERDLPRALAAQKQLTRQYDRTLDTAAFRLALVRALQLPAAERAWLPTLLGAGKRAEINEALIDKTLERWFAQPPIADQAQRLSLLQKGTLPQLRASRDPFIQAALRVWPTFKAEEAKVDARAGEQLLVAPAYVEAMREVLGGMLAPDANSTLRITYGTVKSFKPEATALADGPFTTAAQILTKNTGKAPFDAPAKVLAAIRAKNYGPYAAAHLGGELPVDFTSALDTTGGNSGSPTLNDKGELVGVGFDRAISGVVSEFMFNGKINRVIHVDARYMLWIMDAIDGADHLITELGLQPKL